VVYDLETALSKSDAAALGHCRCGHQCFDSNGSISKNENKCSTNF